MENRGSGSGTVQRQWSFGCSNNGNSGNIGMYIAVMV